MIGLIDLGMGNLNSLENAIARFTTSPVRVTDSKRIRYCDTLVLPGVGHFGAAMTVLRERRMERGIQEFVKAGGRIVGICLGMQLLLEGSAEAPGIPGLGIWSGHCVPFDRNRVKVPHMGWSKVEFSSGRASGDAYFVHSYFWPVDGAVSFLSGTDRWGIANYGDDFIAACSSGRITGFQFHPEKSGPWGLRMLEEVLTWS